MSLIKRDSITCFKESGIGIEINSRGVQISVKLQRTNCFNSLKGGEKGIYPGALAEVASAIFGDNAI